MANIFRMSGSEERVTRSSRYPLRDRSKIKKLRFEVPEWAGENSVNTCIVDGFLATLLCAKWKDPSFASLIKGQSKFTLACREFLDGGDGEVDVRKEDFIKKLFKPDRNGEFDLEGDEASVILDKAKEACQIAFTSKCNLCGVEISTIRDYYYAGREDRTGSELLYTALAQTDRRHRCPNPLLCEKAEKNVDLEPFDTTWMIPIDISQVGWLPSKISSLPPEIEITGVNFRLRGVSLFGEAHYTSVLFDDIDWYYYDGIKTPPIKVSSSFRSLVVNSCCRIKIAYYLRVT